MKALLAILLLLLAGCAKKIDKPIANQTSIPTPDISSLDSSQSQILSNSQVAVRSQPQSADAWGRLGQVFEALELKTEAEICYQRAVELDPASGRWLYLLALVQLEQKPDLALSNLILAVQKLPATNDAPRLRLAQALIERARISEAESHLQSLLALNPNHPAARLELARIKLAQSNHPFTLELLRPALTNAYTTRPALLLLSQAHQRSGDHAGATVLARRAAALPEPFDWPDPFLREIQSLLPNDQNLSERANQFIMQGRFDEAESLLIQLTQRAPQNPEPLLLMGRLRIQQRRCAEAGKFLQQHLTLRTNSLQGYVQLGLAHYCESRWQDAAEAFRKATELKPDFAQAHYNLALALSRLNNSPAAISSFQSALRINPADANAHAELAEELLRTGDKSSAHAHATEALRIHPQHPKATKLLQSLGAQSH
jgi:tetratricopeptide (TPR) repeat protein